MPSTPPHEPLENSNDVRLEIMYAAQNSNCPWPVLLLLRNVLQLQNVFFARLLAAAWLISNSNWHLESGLGRGVLCRSYHLWANGKQVENPTGIAVDEHFIHGYNTTSVAASTANTRQVHGTIGKYTKASI